MPDLTAIPARAGRFTLRHRRPLAAVFAALAVLFTLQSLTAGASTVDVVVAEEAITAGTPLEASMLSVREFPTRLAPDDALTDTEDVVGRPLGAAVGAGEPLTRHRLLNARATGEPGTVLAPVRIEDPAQVSGVEAGDVVTVVATDPQSGEAEILARAATVHGVTTPGEAGMQILIAHVSVDEPTALKIATAAGRAPITLMVQAREPSPS